MKNAISLIASLLLLNLYVSACTVESLEEKQAKEEQARKAHLAEEAAKRNQIIAELKTSHNADDTWDKGSIAWTAELQDRLFALTDARLPGLLGYGMSRSGMSSIEYI